PIAPSVAPDSAHAQHLQIEPTRTNRPSAKTPATLRQDASFPKTRKRPYRTKPPRSETSNLTHFPQRIYCRQAEDLLLAPESTAMARVELQKVTKIYPGGVKAVDAIDLNIENQQFVVLVGPSGCGKSTTLRMIAGLEEISDGIIRIGERVVNDVPPKNRDIAMVFQNYALYPHMTVYKNMAFGLKLRRMPKPQIHQRVMEAAKILDIEHLLDRKPKALSGGQRQRVAVGRAIVREPAAFLFDEPLSNLDAKLRVTTRAELKRLHHRLKTTTIYVTHDQEEAMTLGDRIVVMKDGVIQQADTPLKTYSSPVNRFVAGFIGMPPMNFFDGCIKMIDGRMMFEEGVLKNARIAGTGAPVEGNGKKDAKETDEPVVLVGELTLPGQGFKLPIPQQLRE